MSEPHTGSLAPETFDAAAYVKLWRDAGNLVGLTVKNNGRALFGFHNPKGLNFPPNGDLERFAEAKKADPDWKQKIIDFLASEKPPQFV